MITINKMALLGILATGSAILMADTQISTGKVAKYVYDSVVPYVPGVKTPLGWIATSNNNKAIRDHWEKVAIANGIFTAWGIHNLYKGRLRGIPLTIAGIVGTTGTLLVAHENKVRNGSLFEKILK